jgi:hypothetical protein
VVYLTSGLFDECTPGRVDPHGADARALVLPRGCGGGGEAGHEIREGLVQGVGESVVKSVV